MRLATLPTPIEPAPALARELGVAQLFVKRDDRTADPWGGNKVRKLEFFFGQALAENKRAVLTFGGVGSNHALATAVHARRVGLDAQLLLLPQQPSPAVRHNLLAAHAHGAQLVLAHALDERVAARPFLTAPAPEDRPYVIPTGGTAPIGDAGIVNAGLEIADQVAAGELPEPDELWVAYGTGGTAAGLALGLAAAGLRTRVMCVRVSSPRYASWSKLKSSFDRTRDHLRALDPSFPNVELLPERAELVDGFAGRGYGIASSAGRAAAELAARTSSLELDASYTQKALAALAHHAKRHHPRVVVFYHSFDARQIAPSGPPPDDFPSELRAYVR